MACAIAAVESYRRSRGLEKRIKLFLWWDARTGRFPLPPSLRPLKGGAVITIDDPEDASIFQPEITPPTFLWRDSTKGAAFWHIDVSFADGAPPIHAVSKGERPRIDKIDPDCVADTNEPPKLTPRTAAHSRSPDAET